MKKRIYFFGVKNGVIHWSKTQLYFKITPFWSKIWSNTLEMLVKHPRKSNVLAQNK